MYQCLRSCVANILQQNNFNKSSSTALNMLTEITADRIGEIGRLSQRKAYHCSRTASNAADVYATLKQLGYSEFRYVPMEGNEEIRQAIKRIKEETEKHHQELLHQSELCQMDFSRSDQKPEKPDYVPDFFPPFPPKRAYKSTFEQRKPVESLLKRKVAKDQKAVEEYLGKIASEISPGSGMQSMCLSIVGKAKREGTKVNGVSLADQERCRLTDDMRRDIETKKRKNKKEHNVSDDEGDFGDHRTEEMNRILKIDGSAKNKREIKTAKPAESANLRQETTAVETTTTTSSTTKSPVVSSPANSSNAGISSMPEDFEDNDDDDDDDDDGALHI